MKGFDSGTNFVKAGHFADYCLLAGFDFEVMEMARGKPFVI